MELSQTDLHAPVADGVVAELVPARIEPRDYLFSPTRCYAIRPSVDADGVAFIKRLACFIERLHRGKARRGSGNNAARGSAGVVPLEFSSFKKEMRGPVAKAQRIAFALDASHFRGDRLIRVGTLRPSPNGLKVCIPAYRRKIYLRSQPAKMPRTPQSCRRSDAAEPAAEGEVLVYA